MAVRTLLTDPRRFSTTKSSDSRSPPGPGGDGGDAGPGPRGPNPGPKPWGRMLDPGGGGGGPVRNCGPSGDVVWKPGLKGLVDPVFVCRSGSEESLLLLARMRCGGSGTFTSGVAVGARTGVSEEKAGGPVGARRVAPGGR